ncbi:MAG: histidine kinase [Xanthomonadaceae bacterium]|jgi:signal transduction histidine kinase|nr:histidine kinase [Xanthomonadaceae bacterium]
MDALRRRLPNPLILAALMVWLGVGLDLLDGEPAGRGPLDGHAVYVLTLLLHVAFLGVLLLDPERKGTGWRRWWPDVLLVTVVLVSTALRPYTATPVLLIVAMGQLAGRISVGHAIVTWIAVNVTVYAILAVGSEMTSPLVNVSMMASFQLFAMGVGWSMRSAERARDQLAQVNAELLATRSLLAQSARDQERLRLARELHDVAGHKLTALKLNLAAAARRTDPPPAPEVALSARLADELLSDIRGVVAQMRAHDGMDLRAAIEQLAAPLPRPKVHVDVAPDATVDTVEQAETVVRAVQEALTNAARHAEAANVWIALRRAEGRLEIEVRDDGRGTASPRFGNGLNGMRERLRALGGDVELARTSGGGTALHAWLRLA